MDKLAALKKITKKPQLARLLGVKPSSLTYSLYKFKPETQYYQFEIPKRNGGMRVISAPTDKLKVLQSKLSVLLQDCIEEINAAKFPKPEINRPKALSSEVLKVKISGSANKQPSLSHGFVRDRSIITNAMMHLNQKNVLNIDLKDFFDSFNFGRVRGFFIKNKNFELDPHIATVIAQIACYNNTLPQGSPCSPVITNLITHSLDIRLASLAKKYSCTYSRYADDITFSSRKSVFPTQIMRQEESGEYTTGNKLRYEITRAGFAINDKKTRIQYKDSRQDVTGLIVNKKPNVKKEYWRTVRSQCHRLFDTGSFIKKNADGEMEEGNINVLEGQLNFIDQIDRYNRLRQKPALNPMYVLERDKKTDLKHTKHLLNSREKTFSRFLFYRLFYGNNKPTFLCEGKTDNVYLKSAISILVANYPSLATPKTQTSSYELLVRFLEYSRRTRFLLELFGGTDYLKDFIGSFEASSKFYKAPKPQHPVIIVLDNDEGPKGLLNYIVGFKSIKPKLFPPTLDLKTDIRKATFIHVVNNLYIVLTPLNLKGEFTDIESLFDDEARLKQYKGKCFNTAEKREKKVDLSKDSFANHIIKAQKGSINFDGLRPLLDRVVAAMNHYDAIKHL